MKNKRIRFRAFLCAPALACIALLSAGQTIRAQGAQPVPLRPPINSPADKQAVELFEESLKQYLKLRGDVKDKVPKLSKDATAEQIDAYRTALEAGLRAARAGAKRGDLFKPEVSGYIRRTLKTEIKGKDRAQIREIIFEAETEGVPIRINYPYPQAAEIAEMPAKLLLRLPQLPKELRYRFVGRSMLLVDRENNLILDYMTNALP